MIYSLGVLKYRIEIRSVESEPANIIAALEMGNPSCSSSLGKGESKERKRKI